MGKETKKGIGSLGCSLALFLWGILSANSIVMLGSVAPVFVAAHFFNKGGEW